MLIKNEKWNKIDENNESIVINDITFSRPINSKTVSIDCPECKVLLCTIEDCESYKKFGLCEEWSYSKSFTNKDDN